MGVPSELERFNTARSLIEMYGESAADHAARFARFSESLGIGSGRAAWYAVRDAIEEIMEPDAEDWVQ